jgi:hypothetical protein
MRFKQFYSHLFFRVDLDLIGWPTSGNLSGGVIAESQTPPNFLKILKFTADQQRGFERWKKIQDDLSKNCCSFATKQYIIDGMLSESSQPSRMTWTIEVLKNRVPEYPDVNDPRFNLTGSAAIKRCIEESLSRPFVNDQNIEILPPFTLSELQDRETVTVSAILIA